MKHRMLSPADHVILVTEFGRIAVDVAAALQGL
jgi:hypothetical protein